MRTLLAIIALATLLPAQGLTVHMERWGFWSNSTREIFHAQTLPGGYYSTCQDSAWYRPHVALKLHGEDIADYYVTSIQSYCWDYHPSGVRVTYRGHITSGKWVTAPTKEPSGVTRDWVFIVRYRVVRTDGTSVDYLRRYNMRVH